MKKTFLQMILNEVTDAKNSLATAKKKRDESGKIILDPETKQPQYVHPSMNIFKNNIYKKIVDKFKNDPAYKNQFNIIKTNNILYLNRLLGLIRSKDPSLTNLRKIMDITVNDQNYMSSLTSFIVPFKDIVTISKKIKHEELWDDESFLTLMRNNAFDVKLPSGDITPSEKNVNVVWNGGNDELSIEEFSNLMKIIVSNSQKYVDVRDALLGSGDSPTAIRKILSSKQINEISVREEVAREKFIDSLSKFINLMQVKNADNTKSISLKNINVDSKSIDEELKKLEDEKEQLENSISKNKIDELQKLNKKLSDHEEYLRKKSNLISLMSFFHSLVTSKKMPTNLNTFNIFSSSEQNQLKNHDISSDELDFIKKVQVTSGKIKNDMITGVLDTVSNIIKPITDLESTYSGIFVDMIVKKIEESVNDSINHVTEIKKIKSNISTLKTENQGIESAVNKINIISIQINKLKDSKNHTTNFSDKAFEELLSGDNTNHVAFFLKDPKIFIELKAVREKFKDLERIYNSYPSDCKKIVDSSFLDSDKVRLPFINIIGDLNKIIKKAEEIGKNLYELKNLIKTIKKEGELPLDVKNKTILNSVDSKAISSLYDDIVKIILRFRTFLRVEGFITIFGQNQFDIMIDVSKLDVSASDDLDNYYVQVSIVPEDVRNQSTFKSWISCQTLDVPTVHNDRVGSGYLLGTIAVYFLAIDYARPTGGGTFRAVHNVIYKAGLKSPENKKIKTAVHSAHQNLENIMTIDKFKELAEKGIVGTKRLEIRQFLRSFAIQPIGRVLIKTFHLNENGVEAIHPQIPLEGGSKEEVATMKIVDNLYSEKNKDKNVSVLDIVDKNGNNYTFDVVNKYNATFLRAIKALGKRLNYPTKTTGEGEGYSSDSKLVYDDTGIRNKKYTTTLKKFDIGAEINFSRESTEGLLSLLQEDPNMIRLKTFRHALFSKDRIDGTLDLSGSKVESLDPMHPTNLPSSSARLSNDRSEKIKEMNGAWMVNDNFRKDSGDFDAPLTKSELALYEKAAK